jgi:hypothetical protein
MDKTYAVNVVLTASDAGRIQILRAACAERSRSAQDDGKRVTPVLPILTNLPLSAKKGGSIMASYERRP